MKILKNKLQLVLYCVVGLLLVSNALLIYQNLHLRSQLGSPQSQEIEVGKAFIQFQGKTLNNEDLQINYSESNKKTVLLFFRTTCGFCHKQMKFWKTLVEDGKREQYRFIAVTTDTDTQAIKDYLKKYEIEDWETLIIDSKQAEESDLLATPITVVVDNKGVVEKSWTGFWQNDQLNSAEKYFAVNFPRN